VIIALKQMAPLKAPGPDGLPADFFQNHWDLMGEEVCLAVLNSLNDGILPENINMTHIVLIPKKKNPTTVMDFRPISLCNVLYKLISKVLANRLKKILPIIISQTQSAFIPGRLITDNILAAYETLHTMNSKMKGKEGFMAVKVDMSKAYDRVEWSFLKEAMSRMGFAPRWVQLIMMCVSTVKYAVVVNGNPSGYFQPTRGLRQGDPISPYLFLICAEVLSSMVSEANNKRLLTGVPTSKYGPRVSHLIFADDSLFFCRSSLNQWNELTRLLQGYESASGQRLNCSKTAIFFSKNTPQDEKRIIVEAAGIPVTQRYDKYLGLPALIGKSRMAAFKGIKDRVWKRMQDWKVKFLSQAGKEILLKSVIQAIPTYGMSVFLLPKTLCKEINSLMQKFWWDHQDKSRVHWMSWKRMGLSKADGGLGFRDLRSFNLALLAKQAWRLWHCPNSFLAQIMEAKYYRGKNFLESKLGNRPSFAWRSIHGSCSLLKEGLIWRIGNGSRVRIWKDKWLPHPSTFMVQSKPVLLDPNATVNALIDGDTHWWNLPLLDNLFTREEAQLILTLPVSMTSQEDTCIWRGTNNGSFSVRSAYYIQREIERRGLAESSSTGERSKVWQKIWNLKIPNVEKTFLWRACHESLPTRQNLKWRNIIDDASCPICRMEEETAIHILWQCPSAKDVWSMGPKAMQKSTDEGRHFKGVVEAAMVKYSLEDMAFFAGVARRIWLRRNEVVHGGVFTHPKSLVQQAQQAMENFDVAQKTGETQCLPVRISPPQRWTAPLVGWVKVNSDASVNLKRGWMGFGAVVRDERGEVLAAQCKTVKGCLDATLAEAGAMLMAIKLCQQMGFLIVHVEGDTQVVVNGILSPGVDWSGKGLMLGDIAETLKGFYQWRISYISRDGNQAAHGLSKLATTKEIDYLWINKVPDCIHDIILMEQHALSS
jgi:ribonuclease HI